MPTYQDKNGRAVVHSYIEGSALDNTLRRDGWTTVADSQSYVDDDIYQAVPEINQLPFHIKKHSDKVILEEILDNVYDVIEAGGDPSDAGRAGIAQAGVSTAAPDDIEGTKKSTSKK